MSAVLHNGWAIVSRRPKLLLAVGLTLVLLLVSTSTSPVSVKDRTQSLFKNSPFAAAYTFRGQAVLEDAHRLKDADEFLPHFKAVVEYPSMPMADAKAGCGWPNEDGVNLQWGYDATRGDDLKWIIEDEDDYKIELLRKQWQYFVTHEMRPWAQYKRKFSGRGIVIPAGHKKSVYRTKIILHMLAKLGSTLPVEIAYWGENELLGDTKQELMDIRPDLYFNDLSMKGQPVPTYYSVVNYQLKIPAVINSRFAEVLLLDSDNIPVIDPAELFESEAYKEYGSVFWPDIARTRKQNPMWAITNTQCRMDEWEQESGQVLIDKRRFWYHLQLGVWLETEHFLYYTTLILGDKDMFRFAWHALRTKFGTPSRWITSVGTLSPGEKPGDKELYCGHTFAQHHPDKDGKIAFLHGGLLKTFSRDILDWHLANKGGIFQAYKRAWDDQDKRATPRAIIGGDQAHMIPEDERSEEYSPAWCTDYPDTKPEPLDNLLPGFNKVFEEAGGYWMLDIEEEQREFRRAAAS